MGSLDGDGAAVVSDEEDVVPLSGKDMAAYLIGRGGVMKRRLEELSSANIDVLHEGQSHSRGRNSVTLRGSAVARRRARCLMDIALDSRQRRPPLRPDDWRACGVESTLLPIPAGCDSIVIGSKGNHLRGLEQEHNTLAVVCSDDRGRAVLAVFGPERGRLACRLAAMAAVESKLRGHYTADATPCHPTIGLDTSVFGPFDPEEEIPHLVGRGGEVRRKLGVASGAHLEVIGRMVYAAGDFEERTRARDYTKWVLHDRYGEPGSIGAHLDPDSRDDCYLLEGPETAMRLIFGVHRRTAAKLEDQFGVVALRIPRGAAIFAGNPLRRCSAAAWAMSVAEPSVRDLFNSDWADATAVGCDRVALGPINGNVDEMAARISRVSGASVWPGRTMLFIAGTQPQRQQSRLCMEWLYRVPPPAGIAYSVQEVTMRDFVHGLMDVLDTQGEWPSPEEFLRLERQSGALLLIVSLGTAGGTGVRPICACVGPIQSRMRALRILRDRCDACPLPLPVTANGSPPSSCRGSPAVVAAQPPRGSTSPGGGVGVDTPLSMPPLTSPSAGFCDTPNNFRQMLEQDAMNLPLPSLPAPGEKVIVAEMASAADAFLYPRYPGHNPRTPAPDPRDEHSPRWQQSAPARGGLRGGLRAGGDRGPGERGGGPWKGKGSKGKE
eukprot:Hpha_TRINITY_DN14875_c0_g3::TRINITY_DN14875_c0_g3_i1::g.169138::m.169138